MIKIYNDLSLCRENRIQKMNQYRQSPNRTLALVPYLWSKHRQNGYHNSIFLFLFMDISSHFFFHFLKSYYLICQKIIGKNVLISRHISKLYIKADRFDRLNHPARLFYFLFFLLSFLKIFVLYYVFQLRIYHFLKSLFA